MSDADRDAGLPDPKDVVSLRREALLPTERNRGLGTVAVVCTMAGIASGLALATTLMAMQVADTMQTRHPCPHRTAIRAPASNQGFLGVRYVFSEGSIRVDSVLSGTPAADVGLVAGDRVIAINGDRVDSMDEMEARIRGAHPGSRPSILVKRRDGQSEMMRPVLMNRPYIRE